VFEREKVALVDVVKSRDRGHARHAAGDVKADTGDAKAGAGDAGVIAGEEKSRAEVARVKVQKRGRRYQAEPVGGQPRRCDA